MKKIILSLVFGFCVLQISAQTTWYDPLEGDVPHIEGRAWNTENAKNYHRLPDRAKDLVRPVVWWLSTNSTGLNIPFYCNAPQIEVQMVLSRVSQTQNMPLIATAGVDMYVTDCHGVTDWNACPASMSIPTNGNDTVRFVYKDLEYHNIHQRGSMYRLFLPLLSEVKSLKIGIPDSCELKWAPVTQERPIVVYGTSIAQGIAASRPAMAWSSQVARRTDTPVINLGFSGNALGDREVYDLISEIDAQLFVIDCMPNMYPVNDSIVARTVYGVEKIRSVSQSPILLVENCGYTYGKTNAPIENECVVTNRELKKAYEEILRRGIPGVYYMTKEEIGLTPDSQVDGWHASDLGMSLYANAYEKKINEILGRKIMSKFPPVRQRREPDQYEWAERHEQILEQNKTTDPEILMIGNSITHYWSGNPYCARHAGPKSWEKLFKGKRVSNLGMGWDRIENVFWRLYHGELDNCSPQKIFMFVGTNNLQLNSNEEIVEGLIGLADLIKQKQPQAHLYVTCIYPRRGQEERVLQLNTLLKQKMKVEEKVTILDINQKLLQPDGKINESFFSDGLHPNEKGYEVIASQLKEFIK